MPATRKLRVTSVTKLSSYPPTPASQRGHRARLRGLYKRIKGAALERDRQEQERKRLQADAVDLAVAEDLTDKPIRFTLDGKMYSGTICIPNASELWDEEAVVDYLHRSGKWDACSTQTFDPVKFEAEIARGNIPSRTVAKFKVPGKPASPYARITEV